MSLSRSARIAISSPDTRHRTDRRERGRTLVLGDAARKVAPPARAHRPQRPPRLGLNHLAEACGGFGKRLWIRGRAEMRGEPDPEAVALPARAPMERRSEQY